MTNHPSTATGDHGRWQDALVGELLESYAASAFRLAGIAILASLLVPVVLGAAVDWAWAPGIGLAGTGLLAATVGLLGMYPLVNDRSPALAMSGAVGAGVAGLGSLGLVVMVGLGVAVTVNGSPSPAPPVELFVLLALSVTAGLSLALLSFGVPIRLADEGMQTAGTLMIGGGALLLAATTGELLRSLVGVGPPPWVLFPVVVLMAADTLAIARMLPDTH